MTDSFQNVCRQFVSDHVIHSATTLIYELSLWQEALAYEDQEILLSLQTRKDYEGAATNAGWEEAEPYWVFEGNGVLPVSKEICDDEEDACRKLCERQGIAIEYDDPQGCAENEGWVMAEDATFVNLGDQETSEAEDWEELCSEQGIDPYEGEIFEHFVVDDFLARKLTQKGEVVQEFMGFTIWGRGTTGQAIYIDSVIEDIVREDEAERASYKRASHQ